MIPLGMRLPSWASLAVATAVMAVLVVAQRLPIGPDPRALDRSPA
jgi:hypothetical protein